MTYRNKRITNTRQKYLVKKIYLTLKILRETTAHGLVEWIGVKH